MCRGGCVAKKAGKEIVNRCAAVKPCKPLREILHTRLAALALLLSPRLTLA
jgi:hypothetical protein